MCILQVVGDDIANGRKWRMHQKGEGSVGGLYVWTIRVCYRGCNAISSSVAENCERENAMKKRIEMDLVQVTEVIENALRKSFGGESVPARTDAFEVVTFESQMLIPLLIIEDVKLDEQVPRGIRRDLNELLINGDTKARDDNFLNKIDGAARRGLCSPYDDVQFEDVGVVARLVDGAVKANVVNAADVISAVSGECLEIACKLVWHVWFPCEVKGLR